MMKKNNDFYHMETLARWIENNLEEPLSVPIICKKSGYSDRHLQRIFKEITGLTLTNYISQRRLYRCAVAIKTTLTPLDAIASRYHFKSISSFSRAFTRLFGVSPKHFRGENKTDLSMLFGVLSLTDSELPDLELSYVFLDGLELFGLSDTYYILPHELDRSTHIPERSPLEERFSYLTQGDYHEVYTLSQYSCTAKQPDHVAVEYSIGVKEAAPFFSPLSPVFGDYIMLTCKNISIPFADICIKAYWDVFLTRGIARRRGQEIERIVWRNVSGANAEIDYFFMLPIIFDEKVHDLLASLRQP